MNTLDTVIASLPGARLSLGEFLEGCTSWGGCALCSGFAAAGVGPLRKSAAALSAAAGVRTVKYGKGVRATQRVTKGPAPEATPEGGAIMARTAANGRLPGADRADAGRAPGFLSQGEPWAS